MLMKNSQDHFSLGGKIVRNFFNLWLKSVAVVVTRGVTEDQEEVLGSEVNVNSMSQPF